MRMQAEFDPGFRFVLEVGLVLLALKELSPRALDGQIDLPAAMVDAIDQSASAAGEDLAHFVEIEDHIAGLPLDVKRFRIGRTGFLPRKGRGQRRDRQLTGEPPPRRGTLGRAIGHNITPALPLRELEKERSTFLVR